MSNLANQARRELTHIISTDCIRITEDLEGRASLIDRAIQKSAFTICRLILFVFTFYLRQHKA